jgi:hypothetical protein
MNVPQREHSGWEIKWVGCVSMAVLIALAILGLAALAGILLVVKRRKLHHGPVTRLRRHQQPQYLQLRLLLCAQYRSQPHLIPNPYLLRISTCLRNMRRRRRSRTWNRPGLLRGFR